MTIEEAIKHYEDSEINNRMLAGISVSALAKNHNLENAEKCRQMIEWLRELQERRKAPEIVRCGECTHYVPILSNWGKCWVHSSPTEKYRTCQICDYCSWAEKREKENKWVKNPLLTL